MSKIFLKLSIGLLATVGLLRPSVALGVTYLPGSVPSALAQSSMLGHLAGTNVLHLAIGLPLRNQAAMNTLLSQVYNPASTNYHKFLTPAQFASQFGPTTNDYQAVVSFAQSHGLTVTATPANRMLVEVSGKASDIEGAFNITLNQYRHPTENRTYFSPSSSPSVPNGLTVLDVSGLNSYVKPRPKLHLSSSNVSPLPTPKVGSAPFGSYMGYDFRAAYVPGTSLTGAGQKIALVQFDGYLASDIALYEQMAGLPSHSLTNILLNGFNGVPTGTGGEIEVSLDIEMVISMAPGVSQVLVYEGDPFFNFNPNVVLNQIAQDNAAQQVSCSWGWTGGPNATSEQIFQQMALQGQSFFDASGDSDAFLPGEVDNPGGFGFPANSPNITQVGGTTLTTTGPVGAYVAEQVWNWGGGIGSSGGSSSFYAIPSWQQWINMSTNHGSTTGRNIPDVALTADNVFVIAENGIQFPGTGGTSCAAPLWAGFTALVNQQAAALGRPPVGFINPAIYTLAQGASYNNVFNDTTVGNNTWSLSPTNFFAIPGYDLCTGLGTPKGTNLINALAGGLANITSPVISPPPMPPGGWSTTLDVMNGSDPNGSWFLFVKDHKQVDIGSIANGWFITLSTANPVGYAADSAAYGTPTNSLPAIGTSWNTTVAVTNYGPSFSTNVYVSDSLPVGLTLVSSIPSSGTVVSYGSTLVWTLGNLATNAGGTLTLSFTNLNSIGVFTNTATVYSDTSDPNPDDDTATAVATVTLPNNPTLAATLLPHGGGFQLSVGGDSSYLATVQASTNLVSWVNLYSGYPPFVFTDTNTAYASRFYRVLVGP
jgi:uncharacterized repeat protein (TIGR01451 family)